VWMGWRATHGVIMLVDDNNILALLVSWFSLYIYDYSTVVPLDGEVAHRATKWLIVGF